MATPRKHWFKVADSVFGEPWSNDEVATFTRLGAYLNTRWARDGKDAADAGSITCPPAVLLQLTGSGSLARARSIVDRLATHITLTVDRQGTDTVLAWPKFAEVQGYSTRDQGGNETDAPRAVPPPTPTPAPGRKTQDALNPSGADAPKRAERSRRVRPEPSEAARTMADLLAAQILSGPISYAKVPADLTRWAQDFDLMLGADALGIDDLEAVIRWATRDEFWAPNILSPGKLRKQFPALLAKSRQRSFPVAHSNAESGRKALEILRRGQPSWN